MNHTLIKKEEHASFFLGASPIENEPAFPIWADLKTPIVPFCVSPPCLPIVITFWFWQETIVPTYVLDCPWYGIAEPAEQGWAWVENENNVAGLSPVERAIRLGDLYFRTGFFDKAVDSYLAAIALSPESADLYFILSDALFAIGDYHFAAFAIRRALEIDPTLAESTADKREFYTEVELFERQLRVLERYLLSHPLDADAWLVLGYNRWFSKDPEGAKQAFRRAREIRVDPVAETFMAAIEKEKP